jgi:hypothetical protein
VRIDFIPIKNKLWRTGTAKKIMENSHIPVIIKSWLLTHWSWIRFIVFPVVAIMYLGSFLVPSEGSEESKPENK